MLGNEEKNTKTLPKTIASAIKLKKNWLSKICFVDTVPFLGKGVLSLKITQITDNLMKKGHREVIFIGCPTFQVGHPEKSVSSISTLEIFGRSEYAQWFDEKECMNLNEIRNML